MVITVTVAEIYIHEVHAQASIFLRQLHVSNILCAKILFSSRSRIYNNIYSYM